MRAGPHSGLETPKWFSTPSAFGDRSPHVPGRQRQAPWRFASEAHAFCIGGSGCSGKSSGRSKPTPESVEGEWRNHFHTGMEYVLKTAEAFFCLKPAVRGGRCVWGGWSGSWNLNGRRVSLPQTCWLKQQKSPFPQSRGLKVRVQEPAGGVR